MNDAEMAAIQADVAGREASTRERLAREDAGLLARFLGPASIEAAQRMGMELAAFNRAYLYYVRPSGGPVVRCLHCGGSAKPEDLPTIEHRSNCITKATAE